MTKADSLFKFVTDFSFITTLVAIRSILDYLLSVTRKLQNKNSDIAQSIDLIESLKFTIEKVKNNSDSITPSGLHPNLEPNESDKLHTSRALIPYVTHVPRALVPHVSHALHVLEPNVRRAISALVPHISRVLRVLCPMCPHAL